MIGSVLGGKYRIEAELSRGGMGAVYRGRHEIIERTVAIKLLRPELTSNAEMLTRFVNEAKAASAIRHPSIIEIFDYGHTDDGQAYLVMELLEGETLGARIARVGKLPEREAVRIVRSIANALAAAHAKNIIHRDLKPDNVFLVADPDVGERAKVLDFGIAKLAEAQTHHTMTGALMGTPLYMAPEQARSAGTIDHRADLYSLGCIFYELVTGKRPLVGEGAGEIIALHMFATPEPPTAHVADLHPEVSRVIMRLLEKEPADRFASAAELSDTLAAAVGATAVHTAAAPMITGQRRVATANPSMIAEVSRRRRNVMPLVAAGITLAVAGVIAIVLALGGHPAPEAAPPVPAAPPKIAPAPVPAPTPRPPVQVVTPSPPAPEPPRPVAKPRPRPKKQTTDKGSPIETSID